MTHLVDGVAYNLKVPRAKGFMYQGTKFIPFHKFMGGAARFEVISKRLTGRILEDEHWDYQQFYEKCREQNGDLTVDVFVMQSGARPLTLVVPAKNCLFGYSVN